jgi:phosphoribosylamine--glycine ligase
LRDGRLEVAGGRVLSVTATAPTLHLARERAMAGALEIEFDGKQVRSDIALRAAQEEARV